MNPWHDISSYDDAEGVVRVVIETPHDSRVQYALCPDTGLLRVKRVLFSAVHFPANYGFVPRTLGHDAEAVDVLVLGQQPVAPMAIMRVRPIGVLRMRQSGIRDDKLVSVHVDDPMFAPVVHIRELPPYRLAEVERFFDDYRALERIPSEMGGFDGPEAARDMLVEAAKRYAERPAPGSSHAAALPG